MNASGIRGYFGHIDALNTLLPKRTCHAQEGCFESCETYALYRREIFFVLDTRIMFNRDTLACIQYLI